MKPLPLFVMLMLTLAMAVGCNFMKSTMLQRLDDNSFAGQSNGTPKFHGQPRPFRGVPVALKVPTHVDVEIKETYFLYLDDSAGPDGGAELSEVVFNDQRTPRNLNIETKPVMTKKLFTVDFVRPAAGTLDYSAEFTNEQYFKKIENEIVDETIKDITGAINTVAPAFGLKSSALLGVEIAKRVTTATRTIAYARFDIDAPDFEDQLNAFVENHVTGCHDCRGRKPPSAGVSDEAPSSISGPALNRQSFEAARFDTSAERKLKATRQPVLVTPEYVVYHAE